MSFSVGDPHAIRKMTRRASRAKIWNIPKMAVLLPDFSVGLSAENGWRNFFKDTTDGKSTSRPLSLVLCRIHENRNEYEKHCDNIHLAANLILSTTADSLDNTLNKLHRVLGPSLCGIESRLGVAHFHEGRLKNKEEKSKIEELIGDEDLVKFVLYYMSIKAESTFDHKGYASLIEDHFKGAFDDRALFVRAWLSPWDQRILRKPLNASSLVGIFGCDLLVSLAKSLFIATSNGESKNGREINAELTMLKSCLGNGVANAALDLLYRLRGISRSDVFDLYSSGNYAQAQTVCLGEIALNPWRLDILELLFRTQLRLRAEITIPFEPKSLGYAVSEMIRDILLGDKYQYDQRERLLCIANAFSTLPFSQIILSFCHRMFGSFDRALSDDIIACTSHMLPLDNPHSSLPKFSNISQYNPLTRKCRDLPPGEIESMKSLVPAYRYRRFLALALNKTNRCAEAYGLLADTNDGSNSYLCRSDGFRIKLLSLSRSASDQLPIFFSQNYVKSHSYVFLADIPILLASVRQSGSKGAEYHMHAAITLHAISRHVSTIKNIQEDIKQAVIRWWLAAGQKPPSAEIVGWSNGLAAIYFAENILKVESMDGLWCYSSSDQAMDDRIKILIWLLENNTEKSASYKSEINSIIQMKAIQSGLNAINKSKITLDRANLASRVSSAVSAHYKRATAMPSSDDAQVELIMKQVKRVLETVGGSGKSAVVLVVPESERAEQIAKIVSLARDEFAWSNELGLNSYISMNIRHGTLEGQLRGVFMKLHLITQRDSTSGKYADNSFWHQNFQQIDLSGWTHSSKALEECSRDLDELIQKIKKQFIQIKTEDRNKDGLIDLTVDSSLIKAAEDQIDGKAGVDLFSTNFLEHLGEVTNRQLSIAAEFLKNDVRAMFNHILDRLERALSVHEAGVETARVVQSMKSSINAARTNIATELNLIASWLSISDREEMSEFSHDLAVGIVNKMLTASHYAPESGLITPNFSGNSLPGFCFVPLTNILFIMADNAVKYSNIVLGELELVAGISCNKSQEGDFDLHIWLRNKSRDNRHKLESLNRCIQEAVDNGDLPLAGREGGTGIQKIVRTARFDLKSKVAISVKPDDESTTVSVTITGAKP